MPSSSSVEIATVTVPETLSMFTTQAVDVAVTADHTSTTLPPSQVIATVFVTETVDTGHPFSEAPPSTFSALITPAVEAFVDDFVDESDDSDNKITKTKKTKTKCKKTKTKTKKTKTKTKKEKTKWKSSSYIRPRPRPTTTTTQTHGPPKPKPDDCWGNCAVMCKRQGNEGVEQ